MLAATAAACLEATEPAVKDEARTGPLDRALRALRVRALYEPLDAGRLGLARAEEPGRDVCAPETDE